MTSVEQTRRRTVLAGLLMLVSCSALLAEVGVSVQLNDDDERLTAYVLAAITESGDPINGTWARYNIDSNTRAVVNDQGDENGDGKPSVLLNTATGRPIVAWSRNSPSGFDVVLSTFVDGAWTNAVALADSPEDELDPHLVMDPWDGSVHLTYWINDSQPRVMHREAPCDLSTWTAPVQVSLSGEIGARPSSIFHGGSLRVVYESHVGAIESTPRQIVVATRESGAFSTEVVATTHYLDPNWPEVHGAFNRLWVDWIDAPGLMSWRLRRSDGTWDPVQDEVFSSTEERDYHVRGKIKRLALE